MATKKENRYETKSRSDVSIGICDQIEDDVWNNDRKK